MEQDINNFPLISIVVPVYNVCSYLDRCIESIIKQTYKNTEILLVDDGSTDGSGEKCEEYALNDLRIKVIHKKNGGLSSARNAAIDVMTGKYMVCVDSDDYIAGDYVEYLYNLLVDNDADLSMCQLKKIYSQEDRLDRVTETVDVLSSRDAIKCYLYQKKFTASAHCKMYRSELFSSLRYPDGRYYEDMAIICQLLDSASKIVISNQQKYYYVQRKNSIMNEEFSPKKMHRIENAEEIRYFIGKMYPDLIKAANARCFLAALQTFREIPFRREYSQYIDLTWKEIVKYRSGIMTDSDVKLPLRMMCISTYCGKNLLNTFASWYTVISRIF